MADGSSTKTCCYLLAHLVHHGLESLWVIHGEVSENLAVELNVMFVQLAHEGRVGHSMKASPSIDARNPKGTEGALLVAAIAILVLQTFFDGVFGDRPNIFTSTKVTFGHSHDALSAGATGNIIY